MAFQQFHVMRPWLLCAMSKAKNNYIKVKHLYTVCRCTIELYRDSVLAINMAPFRTMCDAAISVKIRALEIDKRKQVLYSLKEKWNLLYTVCFSFCNSPGLTSSCRQHLFFVLCLVQIKSYYLGLKPCLNIKRKKSWLFTENVVSDV